MLKYQHLKIWFLMIEVSFLLDFHFQHSSNTNGMYCSEFLIEKINNNSTLVSDSRSPQQRLLTIAWYRAWLLEGFLVSHNSYLANSILQGLLCSSVIYQDPGSRPSLQQHLPSGKRFPPRYGRAPNLVLFRRATKRLGERMQGLIHLKLPNYLGFSKCFVDNSEYLNTIFHHYRISNLLHTVDCFTSDLYCIFLLLMLYSFSSQFCKTIDHQNLC